MHKDKPQGGGSDPAAGEEEPYAPSMPGGVEKEKGYLKLDVDRKELQTKKITETEAYKSLLRLLNMVFNNEEEEITRQALEFGENRADGLRVMLTKGYEIVNEIRKSN